MSIFLTIEVLPITAKFEVLTAVFLQFLSKGKLRHVDW
jgi:hypothetical protein